MKEKDLFNQPISSSDEAKEAASYEKAEVNVPAPNYRKSDDPEKSCETCKFYSPVGTCLAFNFDCVKDFVCDAWMSPQELF